MTLALSLRKMAFWILVETREGALVGSGGLEVASLKEMWGLLSRFDCVYSGYITQRCPGGALAVAMSLRARCFFFPTHKWDAIS